MNPKNVCSANGLLKIEEAAITAVKQKGFLVKACYPLKQWIAKENGHLKR